ncbi:MULTISPECIES: hypothetical protein [Myxococcus]|uniref:Secreted protein n=1 Tax=Myxococcus llanfairpwllgwyngyllgogerychwyrndrobwllllantysiliogogogochensis TaxID=2590453 RepID=A0A540WQU1_9BACT|nr:MULTISPECIES: hypothetical protein [Myxococcus]NTX08302.1 hypothetical protein [Myxococcus sp. CA040A]TQF10784.1 hypothetical protein FJV41_37730 [Myxococcus llanfairpwllgwyngyllgogerychwyrndrobwllllantysiliogogogochensis]
MSSIRPLVAGAVLLSMAVPGAALARAASGFLGSPYNPADAGCFSNYYGSARNNCSTTRSWCIPAVVDPAGSYTVNVVAYAPNTSATVGCYATGVDDAISAVWTSGMRYVSSFGSGARYITLTGAYVPGNGQLFVCCDVGPGAGVNGILW